MIPDPAPQPTAELLMELSAREEFRRYWRIVLAASLGTAFGSMAGYTFGVFAEPLARAFGVSLASVGAWNTLWVAATILVAPLVGRLADRFGGRRVALVFNPLLAFSLAGCAAAGGSIWTLYLGALMIGATSPGASPLIYGRVVNTWFKKGRGVALGLMSAGIGLSSIVGPRLAQGVMDAHGWRAGFLTLGAATLLGFIFLFLWLRERRDFAEPGAAPVETGHSRREAFRLPTFWLMAAGNLLWGLSVGGTNFIVPFLTEHDVSRSQAATYASLFGVASLMGRVGNGFVIARFSAPYICGCAFFAHAVAFGVMNYCGAGWALAPVLILGLMLGVVANCLDYCTARYFGVKSYSEISGMLLIANGIGIAISTPLFGYLRDVSGAYAVPYVATAVTMLAPSAVMFLLGRHPFLKDT